MVNYAKEAFIGIYREIHFDYFYLVDLMVYVNARPMLGCDEDKTPRGYGKSNAQAAKDVVTVWRFMLSTGDFLIRKDAIGERFSTFPETFVTEDEMKFMEEGTLNMLNGDKKFSQFNFGYEIVLINEDAKIPEHIPDEVAAVFQHV